jgi:type VI secretion system protein ImpJ
LNRDALANSQVQVIACRARMKDGTLIALTSGQEPDRIDLKKDMGELSDALGRLVPIDLSEAFQQEARVRVYLAVPKLQMGQTNVTRDGAAHDARYREAVLPLEEESQGGDRQEIALRRLNVRLLLSTQDTSGYELLPIAQIARAGERAATPRLDDEYIPPVLAVDAWQELRVNYVQAIYDLIGEKIELLSQMVLDRGVSFSSQEPGDLDRLLMLMVLNGAYAKMRTLAFAPGVHPFLAYTDLCQVVGELSIFDEEARRLGEVPLYDHDDLERIFRWLKREFERLLQRLGRYDFEQRYFIGTANKGMEVALEPKWFQESWKWFVGVQPFQISPQECEALLTDSDGNGSEKSSASGLIHRKADKRLDWKFGAASEVEKLYQSRIQGLKLVRRADVPTALPRRAGWIFFEVQRGNTAWQKVQYEQTLGMRFNVSLIRNLDTLVGQRKLEVATDRVNGALEFALFAVPKQS